jgi:hypothetical protein
MKGPVREVLVDGMKAMGGKHRLFRRVVVGRRAKAEIAEGSPRGALLTAGRIYELIRYRAQPGMGRSNGTNIVTFGKVLYEVLDEVDEIPSRFTLQAVLALPFFQFGKNDRVGSVATPHLLDEVSGKRGVRFLLGAISAQKLGHRGYTCLGSPDSVHVD